MFLCVSTDEDGGDDDVGCGGGPKSTFCTTSGDVGVTVSASLCDSPPPAVAVVVAAAAAAACNSSSSLLFDLLLLVVVVVVDVVGVRTNDNRLRSSCSSCSASSSWFCNGTRIAWQRMMSIVIFGLQY